MNLDFIDKLKMDFPEFTFSRSNDFRWSPEKKTIFYANNALFEILILHELAHAILGHEDFNQDIELLKIETEAWKKTAELAKKYCINFSESFAQSNLNSYRDWIHKRSLCSDCKINGFQHSDSTYLCPACGKKWKTNDSRFKQLRRTKIK